jgi:hypothetical protein
MTRRRKAAAVRRSPCDAVACQSSTMRRSSAV